MPYGERYGVTVFGTLDGASPGVIEAAGDYADNDVLSNSDTNGEGVAWKFGGLGRVLGGSGRITGAVVTTSAEGFAAGLRLWLFSENPSASELDDNAAFALAAADRAKLVGWIDLAASGDYGAVSVSQNLALSVPYKCHVSDDALYGILQVTDAETNEAEGMTVTIALHAEQD